jgi:phenylalanyl-tRNA synthetase beta chain
MILGRRVTSKKAASLLNRLGLEASESGGVIKTLVPTRRPDITIEEDLIEEIARLDGYDSIPGKLPSGRHRAGGLTREQSLLRHVRRLLVGAGLWEAQTNSLIGPSDLERSGLADNALRIVNALSVEESLLRPTLLPGLIAAASRNASRRNLSIRLFEIGHCFLSADDILPAEPLRLGLVIHGPVEAEWHTPNREMDFFDLKGAVQTVLHGLRVPEATYESVETRPFHPGRAAAIKVEGRDLGTIGEVAPEIGARYDLPYRAMAGELELGAILELARPPQLGQAARFPAALVDLAVEVPEQSPASKVLASARASGGEYLEEARIFDVYRGEQIGEGNKSIAMSLKFRHPSRTLTDTEVLGWRDAISAAITKEFGGRVRSS